MSIDILRISSNTLGNKFTKIFPVDNKSLEALPDYVRRIRKEKGLSTTQVETNSRKGGAKGVSNAYVSQIENGYIQNVSPDKLKALAIGLVVSEEEIFAIARGKPLDKKELINERFTRLAEEYVFLTDQERRAVDSLLLAIELLTAGAKARNKKDLADLILGKPNEMQNIDGQELATHSKKKIPLDRGIEKKRKAS